MKQKRKGRVFSGRAFLAALLLIAASAFPAAAQEGLNVDTLVMPTGDLAVRKPSKPMELLSGAEAQALDEQMAGYQGVTNNLLINTATSFYYYENLNPVAKEIYDLMYQVAQDPVSEGNIGFMMTDMDPNGDEFYHEFNVAYRAICLDHPELFWLYQNEAEICYSSEAVNYGGFYIVYIRMYEPFYAFEEQMNAFNEATAAFLKDINMVQPQYNIIRQVHDKLLDLVNYNDPVFERIFSGPDLAHTAYGCLVADSSGIPHYAVCDGYSLAFEYLLHQCGIDAIVLLGLAGGDESDAGGHAWNMVKMDGEWYEVDSTWNDSGSRLDNLIEGSIDYTYTNEALSDPVWREKLDHYLFLVSTGTISHYVPGTNFDYVTKDQQYVFHLISESVHIRLRNDGTMEDWGPDPYVIDTAPIAMSNFQ